MIIKLSLDSDKPLYQQLKNQIIYELATGKIKEGERLPSVRRLSSSLSINMHTVNKAYNQLADCGFLSIQKGRGAIVNAKKAYIASDEDIKDLKEQIKIICAQIKCRSISQSDYLDMCDKAYSDLREIENG